jgi:putative Mg2+ transporter-C (MgtC) family protein
MDIWIEGTIKLLLAVLVGGAIGLEREYRDKAAGFRTLIFICVGSTLFTIFSLKLGDPNNTTRIAANIVSGIGFLGAGAIMRGSDRVFGLTTAATIWVVAALGMGVGGGQYAVAGAGTLVTLIVLWLFPRIEAVIDNANHAQVYAVVCAIDQARLNQVEALFLKSGLRVRRIKRTRSGEQVTSLWHAGGAPKNHERLVEALLTSADVIEFSV